MFIFNHMPITEEQFPTMCTVQMSKSSGFFLICFHYFEILQALFKVQLLSRGVEPTVFEALGGRGPLGGVKLQHGLQEGGKLDGVPLRPVVLLRQDVEEAPGFELGDVAQLT